MTASMPCSVPAAYPANLTVEEDALVAELRAKYRGGGAAAAAAAAQSAPPAALPAPAQQAPDNTGAAPPSAPAVPGVRLCRECGGSGECYECYDSRRIQRCCATCEDTGTLAEGAAAARKPGRGASARLEACKRELEEQRWALEACTDGKERELRRDLVAQLERQAARLLESWQRRRSG